MDIMTANNSAINTKLAINMNLDDNFAQKQQNTSSNKGNQIISLMLPPINSQQSQMPKNPCNNPQQAYLMKEERRRFNINESQKLEESEQLLQYRKLIPQKQSIQSIASLSKDAKISITMKSDDTKQRYITNTQSLNKVLLNTNLNENCITTLESNNIALHNSIRIKSEMSTPINQKNVKLTKKISNNQSQNKIYNTIMEQTLNEQNSRKNDLTMSNKKQGSMYNQQNLKNKIQKKCLTQQTSNLYNKYQESQSQNQSLIDQNPHLHQQQSVSANAQIKLLLNAPQDILSKTNNPNYIEKQRQLQMPYKELISSFQFKEKIHQSRSEFQDGLVPGNTTFNYSTKNNFNQTRLSVQQYQNQYVGSNNSSKPIIRQVKTTHGTPIFKKPVFLKFDFSENQFAKHHSTFDQSKLKSLTNKFGTLKKQQIQKLKQIQNIINNYEGLFDTKNKQQIHEEQIEDFNHSLNASRSMAQIIGNQEQDISQTLDIPTISNNNTITKSQQNVNRNQENIKSRLIQQNSNLLRQKIIPITQNIKRTKNNLQLKTKFKLQGSMILRKDHENKNVNKNDIIVQNINTDDQIKKEISIKLDNHLNINSLHELQTEDDNSTIQFEISPAKSSILMNKFNYKLDDNLQNKVQNKGQFKSFAIPLIDSQAINFKNQKNNHQKNFRKSTYAYNYFNEYIDQARKTPLLIHNNKIDLQTHSVNSGIINSPQTFINDKVAPWSSHRTLEQDGTHKTKYVRNMVKKQESNLTHINQYLVDQNLIDNMDDIGIVDQQSIDNLKRQEISISRAEQDDFERETIQYSDSDQEFD